MLLTNSDFGIPRDKWDAAKQQARAQMIERARVRGLIAYSELVRGISAIAVAAYDTRLFHLLGEISSDEDAAGRGMLTALVVHKTGDRQPGPGFFELAKHLGRDTSDNLGCWVKELDRVYTVWALGKSGIE